MWSRSHSGVSGISRLPHVAYNSTLQGSMLTLLTTRQGLMGSESHSWVKVNSWSHARSKTKFNTCCTCWNLQGPTLNRGPGYCLPIPGQGHILASRSSQGQMVSTCSAFESSGNNPDPRSRSREVKLTFWIEGQVPIPFPCCYASWGPLSMTWGHCHTEAMAFFIHVLFWHKYYGM